MDFSGHLLRRQQADTELSPLSATHVADFSDAELLGGADPKSTFAAFELLTGDQVVSRNLVFFDESKQLALPRPHIRAQWEPAAGGYALTLSSEVLARGVWLSFGDLDATPSDNSFDLLPGEPVRVTVRSDATLDALRGALRLQDLAGATAGGAP
jgi:beta-mannosidase